MPLLLLTVISLIQFGYVQHITAVTKMASYIGATIACQGKDGVVAVKEYLRENGINPDKDTEVSIERKASIANYYEATVSISGKTKGLVTEIFPNAYQITQKSRMYYSKKFTLTDDQWTAEGEKPLYAN